MAKSMKRQFAEYQVERTAQFLYSFHNDLDKYAAIVQVERALLKPLESHFLCYERAIWEYRLDAQTDRKLYPELPWSTSDPMGIAYVWEKVSSRSTTDSGDPENGR